MVWPFSEQPDWPISDAWREFAFDTVALTAGPLSPQIREEDNFDIT
jgi:hypothetical protein